MVLLAELGRCHRSTPISIAELCLPVVFYWRPFHPHQHFRLEILYFSPLWTWYSDRCRGEAPVGPGIAKEIRADGDTEVRIVKIISKLRSYKFGPWLRKKSGQAAKLVHPGSLDYRVKKTANHHSLAADRGVCTPAWSLKLLINSEPGIFFRSDPGFLLLWYFYWPLRKRQISVHTASLHHIDSNSLLSVLDHLWACYTLWRSPPTRETWLLAVRILHLPLNNHRTVLDPNFYFW